MDKLQSVDWRGLARAASNKIKQYALNLSPLELAVEDATSMDQWGPHGSVMNDIAEACFDPEGYRQVLAVLARRLQEKDERWRMCYKALLLLEHLIKHGPTKVAQDVAASMSVMEKLQRFEFKDPNGKDHGANVRHRAKEIAELVGSPARVAEEREKARANKAKYQGVSAADMRAGGRSGGGGGSRFDPASLVRPGGGGPPGAPSYATGSGGGGSGGAFTGGSLPVAPAQLADPSADRICVGGHVVARQPGGGRSPRPGDDPVAATRARIEKFKMEERAAHGGGAGDRAAEHGGGTCGGGGEGKRRLADVKVNPRIAASLGLKVAPPPARPAAAHATAQGPAAPEIDLLGGLEEPDDVAALPPVAAAAPAADVGSGGLAGDGWDAFGGGGGGAVLVASPPAAAATAAPAAFDPFGAPSPKADAKAKARGATPRAALPEDAFASLGGLAKPLAPMGSPSGLRVHPPPLDSHAAAAPAVLPGFADFGAALSPPPPAASAAKPAQTARDDPFADLFR